MYMLFLQNFMCHHQPGGHDQGIAGDEHVLYLKLLLLWTCELAFLMLVLFTLPFPVYTIALSLE